MKLIALTKGQFAKVDDEDYDFLMQWKWHAQKWGGGYYALRSQYDEKTKKSIKRWMHRIIKNIHSRGTMVMIDHIDRNGLNNQKANLRFANHSQNLKNRKGHGTSPYLGVSKKKSKHKTKDIYYYTWVAEIQLPNKKGESASFPFTKEGEQMAALAYNEMAIKYHGEFANLNIIKDEKI